MEIPSFNQPAVSGRVSWFGGPHDSTDSGHTASGGTTKEPGIAVYNRATLGGYWRVTAPNGRTAVLKQTDLGPAPFTGRKVDVTYSALGHLGYDEHSFPTDAQVHAVYLGKNVPSKGTETAPNATEGRQVPTFGTQATFNQRGYQEAAQKARGLRAAGGLFTGGGQGDQLLREVLQRAGKAPSPEQFGGSQTVQTGTRYILPNNPQQHQAATSAIENEMNHISEAHVPYQRGGGHQGKVIAGAKVTPLDCSGAVSAALGINPKVASEFESWGAPGKGNHMTVWASAGHVLLEVHGRFWGTSGSNPGGGAGWIKPGVITPEYLKGFTPRHLGTE